MDNNTFTFHPNKIVDAIICDLGGVLVDLNVPRCIAAFRRLMGDANMHRVLGLGDDGEGINAASVANRMLMADFERGKVSENAFINNILQYCKPGATRQQVIDAWLSMIDGLPLERLAFIGSLRKAGYYTFMFSNNNELHWRFVVEQFNFSLYFNDIFLSHEIHYAKPEKESFYYVHSAINAYLQRTIGACGHVSFSPKILFIDDLHKNRMAAEHYVGWETIDSIAALQQLGL